MAFRDLLHNLPEVRGPTEKKLGFNTKLKWTLIILVAYFVLSNVPLFGISEGSLSRFEQFAILLGTSFGSIIHLGIGPIVMASLILQLFTGAGIINIDQTTAEGKKFFSALQKLFVFAFILLEAFIWVLTDGVGAMPGFTALVILQICLGGILIVFMDEVIQKYGFGSGVSLFIAGGIGWRLFTALFQFTTSEGGFAPTGHILALIFSVIGGDGKGVLIVKQSDGTEELKKGYFERNEYIGEYKYPYAVTSKREVKNVYIQEDPSVLHGDLYQITIKIRSNGSYVTPYLMVNDENGTNYSNGILQNVKYPCKKIEISFKHDRFSSRVMLDIYKKGNWIVEITI